MVGEGRDQDLDQARDGYRNLRHFHFNSDCEIMVVTLSVSSQQFDCGSLICYNDIGVLSS